MSDDSGNSYLIRKLMSATIVDTRFLKGLKKIWREDLVGNSWKWLAHKCFSYLDEYGEAPGRNIEDIWAASSSDAETMEDMERILTRLSSEWEKSEEPSINPDLLLKEAEKYFTRELYLRDVVSLEAAAEHGDLEEASKIIESLNSPPKIQTIQAINPFLDPEALKVAFQNPLESYVKLGGAFQELVGSQIVQDSFVSFLGKEKVGKTWILQSIAFSGLKNRKNVIFYQCGDLSHSQQIVRLAVQLTGRSNKSRYNGSILSPIMDCERNQFGTCQLDKEGSESIVEDKDHKPYPKLIAFEEVERIYEACCDFTCADFKPASWFERLPNCKLLDPYNGMESWKRFGIAVGDRFRLEWSPTKTLSITDIYNHLINLEDDTGWKPDIVIVDYFDILAVEASGDFRHKENHKWEMGRRLSQDLKCSLITATQANRDSYKKRLLSVDNTSEDKRKGAHVTAMFGLNRDDSDKEKGWLRVNPLLIREDDFSTKDQIVVLQNIQRGNPNLGSFWHRRKK